MKPVRVAAAALLAGLASVPAPAGTREDAAHRGAAYIASRQAPDGGFFASGAAANSVAEVTAAVVAGGGPADAVDRALGYIASHGPDDAGRRGAYAGRLVSGIVAAGRDPRAFGGFDYVARLTSFYDPATGAYDTGLYADALAALGVIAAGEPLPGRALAYLRANQCPDGAFGHDPGCSSGADVDTTALVLSVLVDAGVPASDGARSRAREFLAGAENASGAYGQTAQDATNANSTGLVLSALAALGEDPVGPPWRRPDGSNPLDGLLALQESSGAFLYKEADTTASKDYATVQAVPGAAGRTYPIRPGSAPARAAPASSSPQPAATSRPPARATTAASPPSPSAAPPGAPATAAAVPAARHRATLFVFDGAREVRHACIDFAEASISGSGLLERSGMDASIESSAQGAAVCGLAGEGCRTPRQGCFCRYPTYWHYWTRDAGDTSWTFAQKGAADRIVRDGSADAWVWTSTDRPPPADASAAVPCSSTGSSVQHARPSGARTWALPTSGGGLAALMASAVVLRRRRRA